MVHSDWFLLGSQIAIISIRCGFKSKIKKNNNKTTQWGSVLPSVLTEYVV